ncbi:MAG: hypothetical protein EBR82_25405 [Caulobacteraceae bacterium]|nr:hypothetical protein [Caulobacteraceae bacterium]
MADPTSQFPEPLAAPKIAEATENTVGVLDEATKDHVALVHTARLLTLLLLLLQRRTLGSIEDQQWQAATGFLGAVLQANDALADFTANPQGTLRVNPAEFTRLGDGIPNFRRGMEPADVQSAIAAAVAAEAAVRSTADTTEASARTAADTALGAQLAAETTARAAAVAAEATLRSTADTTEASTRAAADTALGAQITSAVAAEATARDAAITAAVDAIAMPSWAQSAVSRSFDANYRPSTTKWVLITANVSIAQSGNEGQIVLYSDSSSTPSTVRGVVRIGAGNVTGGGMLVHLVPPGHYYRLERQGVSGSGTPTYTLSGGVVVENTFG